MAITIEDKDKKVKMIKGPEELTQAVYIFHGLDPNGHALIECIESSDLIFKAGANFRTTLMNLELV